MNADAFQNVRNQIGFCGIWCGSCAAGNGAILELARKFEEAVEKYQLEKWAPENFDFNEFRKGLGSIQTMSRCPGCLKGGGTPNYKIQRCASSKQMANCSRCDQLMECENFESLEKSHPAIKEELKKIAKKDQNELVEKWTGELKSKWPHLVLFLNSP